MKSILLDFYPIFSSLIAMNISQIIKTLKFGLHIKHVNM